MKRHISKIRLSLLLGALAATGWACSCGRPPLGGGTDAGEEIDGGFDDAGVEPVDGGDDGGFDGGADAGPLTCTSCHGDKNRNPAPPVDTHGQSDRSLRTVGAHQAHLTASNWHRDVLCSDCHIVPQHIEDPGHIDPPPAELTWGPVATASGASPAFDGKTCTNAYCHGTTLTGGKLTTPDWTRSDIAQAYCGDCHGVPPPAPHPRVANWDCSRCHPNASPGLGFKEPQRHVNGILDVKVGCTDCHGSQGNPAPPTDVSGNTSTSSRGVGAHRSHLGPSNWHAEVKCDDCHVVPGDWSDPGHIDSTHADVTWGPKSKSQGAAPSWNTVSCSGVYCHGATLSGGSNTQPNWTQVDGTQAKCGTCHGLPPTLKADGTPHSQSTLCNLCHGAVINADGTFKDPSLHIDGMVEAGGACGSCHDLPPKTGTHLLHAGLANPAYGGLTTAANLATPTGYAFGCGYCHPLDPVKHMSGGLADIELYSPNAPAGSLKALSPPTASYTRGATVFTDPFGRDYTLGTCNNVYCHSGPTYSAPAAVPEPGVDFPFASYPITFPVPQLTRGRTYASPVWGGTSGGCGACHGFPIRTRAPQVQAMVGQSHSYIDASGQESGHAWNHGYSPLPCRTCHVQTVTAANTVSRDASGVSQYGPVPIAGFAQHVNGRPDVVFDTADALPYPTPKDLTTASYNQTTATCSNVACHKNQTSVQHGSPYDYTVSLECNVCHTK